MISRSVHAVPVFVLIVLLRWFTTTVHSLLFRSTQRPPFTCRSLHTSTVILCSNNSGLLETEDNVDSNESSLPDLEEENCPDQNFFGRNSAWLEEATLSILNEDMYPIGELSEEDIEAITSLMSAWSKRKSVDAAITVERLLKRVVDDMQVHNSVARVSTRFYIHVSKRRQCVLIDLSSFLSLLFYRPLMHGHDRGPRARLKELNKFMMP